MRGISIVVPAYNSSKTLTILTLRIFGTMRGMGKDFELILVNDGSVDATWDIIQELASKNDWIVGFNLTKNFGQHNALLCGIRSARFDTCVTLDDDLQHPPEEIPKLIGKLDEGFDVVYGTPTTSQHGLIRNFYSHVVKWVGAVLFRIKRGRSLSAFRAFRTSLARGFNYFQGRFVSIDAMLSWNTDSFGCVKVRHDRRYSEKSNYNVMKLVGLSVTMLFGFNLRRYLHIDGKPPYVVREITEKRQLHV